MDDDNRAFEAQVTEPEVTESKETEPEVTLVETGTVDVVSRVSLSTKKEVIDATYDHARDTMKPGDKLDWFVAGCGIFALICLVVSIVNVVRYGFDILFGLMMAVYVIVAVFCLVKKLQMRLNHFTWKSGFFGKLMANKAEEQMVHFGTTSVSFTKKKETEFEYETLADAYETEHYYIFHFNDRNLMPIFKEDVSEAEQEYADADLHQYFSNLCIKYARKEDTLVD